eukprot:COSAG06_NODE_366_length_16768_cov_145.097246_1_plen_784_part_10
MLLLLLLVALLPLLLAPARAQRAPCNIGALYQHLQEITTNPECLAGRDGGRGPPPTEDPAAVWYPNSMDDCNLMCGAVYEPFWDQCGGALESMGMGGMDEMGQFYERCLSTLYPPGSCGRLCNQHTFECYTQEVHQACCDAGGQNCVAGRDIPNSCPVGCAIVFPPFLDACRDHIAQSGLDVAEYELFEQSCLELDGLALVEYAVELKSRGCQIDLDGGAAPPAGGGGGHRRAQLLGQWISSGPHCRWDRLDDLAASVDAICCVDRACVGDQRPSTCSPGCAVAMHGFLASCGGTVAQALGSGDTRLLDLQGFEAECLDAADPEFFINAIENAVCPDEGATVDPECGNGILDAGEACDDGDRESDDGCDVSCQIETGFTCGRPGRGCADIDECAASDVCPGANRRCENLPGDYACVCQRGFVEEAGQCNPCTDAHIAAGICVDGPSCNAIKLSDPTSEDGVYYIQPQGAAEPLPVTCDMTNDNGGWTLVYKIAGPSTMKTTDAFDPELLASPDAAPEAEHSAKLSDAMIRDLCSEQYRVEQYLSTPTPLYCSFDDLNEYGDDLVNVHKSCDSEYNHLGEYTPRNFDPSWSYGFSTWGGITGSTIIQLNYQDGRHGSHICSGCTPGMEGCGSGGGCHVRVWCRSDEGFLCGNGAHDEGESCDDGNRESDDGCDEMCELEDGWRCTLDAASGVDVCVDIDECAEQVGICTEPHTMCVNIASDYLCVCEHGFVEDAGRCKPCEDTHWEAGVCAEGPSCNAIKLSDPTSEDGVYYIQPQGAAEPLPVT